MYIKEYRPEFYSIKPPNQAAVLLSGRRDPIDLFLRFLIKRDKCRAYRYSVLYGRSAFWMFFWQDNGYYARTRSKGRRIPIYKLSVISNRYARTCFVLDACVSAFPCSKWMGRCYFSKRYTYAGMRLSPLIKIPEITQCVCFFTPDLGNLAIPDKAYPDTTIRNSDHC